MTPPHAASCLYVGAAQVDITPRSPVQLAGDVGLLRKAQHVADPLYARAVVLECEGRKLCVVACDVTIITREYADYVRQAAAQRFEMDPDAVMVHATQTHSAPSLGHFIFSDEVALPDGMDWVRGGDRDYSRRAEERILEAIRLAHERLEPVEMAYGSAIEGRWAHNRRAVTRDGSVMMPGPRLPKPLGWTDMLYLEGPIDPELGVLCFRTLDLGLSTMLVNYTCHPVHVFPKPIVSADWPGALAHELSARYSQREGGAEGDVADCVAMVINGACGNINPWPPFEPEYANDHRAMGRGLADTVEATLQTLSFSGVSCVDWRARHVPIPLREIEPERLEAARALLAEHPEPCWQDRPGGRVSLEWIMAAGTMDLSRRREREPMHDYEVQAFRIGDVALVGLPGEPFVEGQLRIKMASPAARTYVAHCVNQYVGYLPTVEAFRRGGHELATGNWSRLAPEALDTVVDTAVALLHELFEAPSPPSSEPA